MVEGHWHPARGPAGRTGADTRQAGLASVDSVAAAPGVRELESDSNRTRRPTGEKGANQKRGIFRTLRFDESTAYYGTELVNQTEEWDCNTEAIHGMPLLFKSAEYPAFLSR